MHVLIIEDDILLAMNVQVLIEDLGATSTAIVSSESAAVTQAALYRPNLIISDLHLPDGLGASAVKSIRSSFGNIPVVYVTGSADEAARLDPSALVLSKPLKEQELVTAIAQLRPLMNGDP